MSPDKKKGMLSVYSAFSPGYAPVGCDPFLKAKPILFARFSGP